MFSTPAKRFKTSVNKYSKTKENESTPNEAEDPVDSWEHRTTAKVMDRFQIELRNHEIKEARDMAYAAQ